MSTLSPFLEKIYLGTSKIPNAGRGVFAKSNIKKGEVIEKCPIIEIPGGDNANLNKSILVTYFFYFGKNKERLILALGYGSIYNHSQNPNASFKIIPRQKLIEFRAIKNIPKDSEITFDYHGAGKEKHKPLWFEV
jgi:SET domain-containing protein